MSLFIRNITLSPARMRTVPIVKFRKNLEYAAQYNAAGARADEIRAAMRARRPVTLEPLTITAAQYLPTYSYQRLQFPDIWIGIDSQDEVCATTIEPSGVSNNKLDLDHDDEFDNWRWICVGEHAQDLVSRGLMTPSEAFWNTGANTMEWYEWARG